MGESDQFNGVLVVALDIVRTPANVELHIAAVAPAQLLHFLLKCRDTSPTLLVVRNHVHQHTDAASLAALLRACGERPRGY